jgi:hypothetical protein
MNPIQHDGKDQPFIEWEISPGAWNRAWVQHRTGANDFAKTPGGRYLNVVRVEQPNKGPAGNATNFLIYSSLPDEQILESFVAGVCATTGCTLQIA